VRADLVVISDNQLVGFSLIANTLVAGSVTEIKSPEKAKQITYNGS
jgi:hypothetical protein